MKKLFLVGLILLIALPCVAEQIYVKANASLAEVTPEPEFVVTSALKQYLNDNAPIHPVYGVKYLTKSIAKYILKTSGVKAQKVIDALIADGTIKTYQVRYEELYPSPEAP